MKGLFYFFISLNHFSFVTHSDLFRHICLSLLTACSGHKAHYKNSNYIINEVVYADDDMYLIYTENEKIDYVHHMKTSADWNHVKLHFICSSHHIKCLWESVPVWDSASEKVSLCKIVPQRKCLCVRSVSEKVSLMRKYFYMRKCICMRKCLCIIMCLILKH